MERLPHGTLVLCLVLLAAAPLVFAQEPGAESSADPVAGPAIRVHTDPTEPLETGWLLFLRIAETYDVYVDGELRGTTPLLLADLEPGKHSLRVESEAGIHRMELEVSREIEGITYYTPEVHPHTGTLSVASDPPGARVSLDGVDLGPAPLCVEDLESGEYRLSLVREGYMPVARLIMVPRSDALSVEATLERAVSLRFDPALPSGSMVKVYDRANELVLEAPGAETIRVPEGFNLLVVESAAFQPQEIQIEARGGEAEVAFQPVYYTPKLVFDGLPVESRVLLDGVDVTGRIQGKVLITEPGIHEVTVLTEKYLPMTRRVTLTGDEELAMDVLQVRDPAVTNQRRRIVSLSTVLPGLVLSAGGLALNLDMVAVRITDTYSDYVTLKYTTLGAAGAGLVLLTVGGITALLK